MFRRSSYASVAAGNSGQSQSSGPTRSGAFSHLVGSASGAGGGSTSRDTGYSAHHQPGAQHHPSLHAPAHHSGFSASPHTSLYNSHRHHARSFEADGHHGSMSASWGRGGYPSSYPSQLGYQHGHGGPLSESLSSSFFVPSYLRGSRHAEKLEEAHKTKVAAQREYRSNHTSNAGSLSTSSSSANLHKMAPSYRGLTHDVIERAPPLLDEAISPWPTRWNEGDKYVQLELEDSGRTAKFAGSQKTPDEAASVRSDYPMPRQCGIYYYEVTVVSKGKDGMIGVGFSGPKVALTRIPGWEPESYAYHGDDGQCFSNTTSGKPYGPKFGTLDVIGCGINFRTGTAFFTKNGHYLGTAFRDLKADKLYYPTIGMKKPGETLRANFGQEPFAFDIDKMVQTEKDAILAEIAEKKGLQRAVPGRLMDETAFIHGLVSQYLAHDGYVETARAFAEEVAEEQRALANEDDEPISFLQPEEDLDAINRQRIRAAILEGDIDKALKFTKLYYPSVLHDNADIYFKLRCRKFIEMIRKSYELSAQIHHIVPTPPSKRSTTSNGHNDDYDFEMELDEQLGVHNGQHEHSEWHSDGHNGAGLGGDNMDTEDEIDEDIEARHDKLMEETIQYGMELKQEFAEDTRKEVKRALEDTFALIAYENVGESALAPLLESKGRVPVAEELNSAILVSLGKSSSAALERLTQQTEALVNELTDDGGPGAFINVRRDFLQ